MNFTLDFAIFLTIRLVEYGVVVALGKSHRHLIVNFYFIIKSGVIEIFNNNFIRFF